MNGLLTPLKNKRISKYVTLTDTHAVMAQAVEHHLGKVEVPGSNPGNSSKQKQEATKRPLVFNSL